MRDIKYRAFIKDIGVMCPVGALYFGRNYDLEGVSCHIPNGYVSTKNVADVYLMQYTGLKDKNGVKIYEGDVVSMVVVEDKAEYLGDVVFESGCFCLNISLDGTKYKVTALEWKETETIITVIGNIYQNKELEWLS